MQAQTEANASLCLHGRFCAGLWENADTAFGDASRTPSRTRPRLRLQASSVPHDPEEVIMLSYAVIFFIIALVAAALGFGGIAANAAGIAKILFVVFLVLAIASFVLNAV